MQYNQLQHPEVDQLPARAPERRPLLKFNSQIRPFFAFIGDFPSVEQWQKIAPVRIIRDRADLHFSPVYTVSLPDPCSGRVILLHKIPNLMHMSNISQSGDHFNYTIYINWSYSLKGEGIYELNSFESVNFCSTDLLLKLYCRLEL